MKPAWILTYVWLAILAVTLLVSVKTAYQEAPRTEEYAYACDPFGYLRMAKEIRRARADRKYPEFRLESGQTRLLIDFMRSRYVPLERWDELVAPHAHHYMPESNYVGVQYPPGTGLALAMFPEGKAVYGLNRLVVIVFSSAGLIAFLIAVRTRAWASIGLVVLALCLGLTILVRVSTLSFSINAMLVPVLLACVLAVVSLRFGSDDRVRVALLTAFTAGIMLGFASLVRLPAVLLAPGFLILFWPRGWRPKINSLPVAFSLGVVLTGIIPVLVNQQKTAGAWYLSTYSRVDASAPTLERIKENFSFYLGSGDGVIDNWALVYALVGFAGFVLALHLTRGLGASNRSGLSWRRLGLATLVMWIIPTVYFLTHGITGPHYAIPANFGAVALIGFGSLAIEATSSASTKRFEKRNVVWWVALALVLLPGVATFNRVWKTRSLSELPVQPIAHASIVLPSELADEHAWVWADLLTGSLWYYANKPAFKIQFSDRDTRAMLFKFVSDRGEPQYVIQDSGTIKQFMDEIVQLGGTLEERGKVDGQPYFLIHWPADGPKTD